MFRRRFTKIRRCWVEARSLLTTKIRHTLVVNIHIIHKHSRSVVFINISTGMVSFKIEYRNGFISIVEVLHNLFVCSELYCIETEFLLFHTANALLSHIAFRRENYGASHSSMISCSWLGLLSDGSPSWTMRWYRNSQMLRILFWTPEMKSTHPGHVPVSTGSSNSK